MSGELISVLIAVLAVGATLGGLILTGNRGLREDMARMEARLREDMKQLSDPLVLNLSRVAPCTWKCNHFRNEILRLEFGRLRP